MDLKQIRDRIDAVDEELLALLNSRMELVREVGLLKQAEKSVIYRPEREQEILERLNRRNNGLLTPQAIEAIFLEIFAVSRNLELPQRVAFLGPEGSFTHQAAESRFGGMGEYLVLPTIRSVFDSVETGRAAFGVVPVENNQEGIVPETVDLLREKDLMIAAELYLSIHFTLVSRCDSIKDIKKIFSKDIAFRQCSTFLREYFDANDVELVPVDSTSKAARLAAEEPGSAAICSSISAKLMKLPVLFDNIENSDQNRTRFLILGKDFINQPSDRDKTTIIASLPHTNTPGVLYRFLKDFNDRGINLTKIESRPSRNGSDFGFWFFVEFEGNRNNAGIAEIMKKHEENLKWLGSYVQMG